MLPPIWVRGCASYEDCATAWRTVPLPSYLTTSPAPRAIDLDGVRIHALREDECVEHVMSALRDARGGWIVTPNLDHMRRLARDDRLRASYGRADLAVADGMPLVWMARLQRTPLPCRVAGSDLISSLSRAAARNGHSLFLLGGDPGTAEGAAQELGRRFPGLRVAGTACPALGFEHRSDDVDALAAQLAISRADIVFVALGSPKQEALIERLRPILPRAWWLGVGISFSFVAGDVRRAPPWLQRIGLEWLHRMVQEPNRLLRRYLVEDLPFGVALATRSALRGLRARPIAPSSVAARSVATRSTGS
ncbi:MAG: WecB/TagA/CpsF family glycosyltransferase [Planctomycetota bacterium]